MALIKRNNSTSIKVMVTMFGCLAALRREFYLEQTSKINTCIVLIRIIITFANQIFL